MRALTIFMGLFLYSPFTPAEKLNPKFTGEQKVIEKMLIDLFEESKKVNDPKTKKKRRSKIEKAFDWNWIAQACLGNDNWKGANKKRRGQFKSILREIVSLTAYSRMDDFWKGTTYQFKKIDLKKEKTKAKKGKPKAKKGKPVDTAEVAAEFKTKKDSYTLDYYLMKKGNKWILYDLAYEGFRYSENINEQIEAFLGQKKWGELIKKMSQRLKDLRDADKKKT